MSTQTMLQAFQKHLGDIDTQSLEMLDTQGKAHKIERFNHEIKSINESIGALQILQIACQKLLKLESKDRASMQEAVNKARFKEKGLFGVRLDIVLDSQEPLCVQVPNPLEVLESQGFDAMRASLEQGLSSIKGALTSIQESVATKQVFQKTPTLNTPNFSKDALLAMMKSS
ncbi:flagellar FLiS export co-chaperone [Helicobacter felis]|uniref:flagellar FLiS export co-chaperone n=1 Tax=Helicobacter felis TaxID=214 RepID=UPI000CF19EB0|nr:flagellar FLiS export co-chaperone [Helicobacter felis]